jgi:hypothetical protein
MEEILDKIDEARYLAAKEDYDKIVNNPALCAQYSDIIGQNRAKVDLLMDRCDKIQNALKMVKESDSSWILGIRYEIRAIFCIIWNRDKLYGGHDTLPPWRGWSAVGKDGINSSRMPHYGAARCRL